MRTAATGERKEARDQAHKHHNPGLVADEILKGAVPPNDIVQIIKKLYILHPFVSSDIFLLFLHSAPIYCVLCES